MKIRAIIGTIEKNEILTIISKSETSKELENELKCVADLIGEVDKYEDG